MINNILNDFLILHLSENSCQVYFMLKNRLNLLNGLSDYPSITILIYQHLELLSKLIIKKKKKTKKQWGKSFGKEDV